MRREYINMTTMLTENRQKSLVNLSIAASSEIIRKKKNLISSLMH
jgi:hypothetical protein